MRLWPDPKYFDSPNIPMNELEHLVRSKAYCPASPWRWKWRESRNLWKYERGMAQYFEFMLDGRELVAPLFGRALLRREVALGVTDRAGRGRIVGDRLGRGGRHLRRQPREPHPDAPGGTHEAGFRAGIFEALGVHGRARLAPKGVKLIADDLWQRACFTLSARIVRTQFHGQTKEKLTTRHAARLLELCVRDAFELWLNEHADEGKKIVELAIEQAMARLAKGKKVERKKSSGIATLPGKLVDCASGDISRNELFLVEGDSAGGSAKEARDKETQALLPLRGKVLNSMSKDSRTVLANKELQAIATAIGVDPTGSTKKGDLRALRYGKIIVMTDADVDGGHIQALLLTFFFMHAPRLVEAGHLYVAQPPLYKVEVPSQGKPMRRIVTASTTTSSEDVRAAQERKSQGRSWEISRFKGLGR